MPMFKNVYECPCGHTWDANWDYGCDDHCPQCNTSCSPSFCYDLNNPEEVNEMKYNHGFETLEEHTARMKRISDEVKADIKAGRYRHGQIHPHIRGDYARGTVTGRWPKQFDHIPEISKSERFADMYMGKWEGGLMDALRAYYKGDMQMAAFDSFFKPSRRPIPMAVMDECHYIEPESFWIRPTKEKDWDRKTFKSGPATTPNEAVRQKRREERKRKKGSK